LNKTFDLSRPQLYDKQRAASYCGLSARYFRNQVREGRGPTFLKPSARTILFRQSDLDDWMASWQIVPPKAHPATA
jgi:hypothetical protein